MATYLELKAQAEKLMQQAEEARKKEIAEVISGIKSKMEAYGITASDLGFAQRKHRAGKGTESAISSAIRYRGPNGETWSGNGRHPKWIKEAIKQGKSKDDFAA